MLRPLSYSPRSRAWHISSSRRSSHFINAVALQFKRRAISLLNTSWLNQNNIWFSRSSSLLFIMAPRARPVGKLLALRLLAAALAFKLRCLLKSCAAKARPICIKNCPTSFLWLGVSVSPVKQKCISAPAFIMRVVTSIMSLIESRPNRSMSFTNTRSPGANRSINSISPRWVLLVLAPLKVYSYHLYI